jgi:hypothetical protein
MGFPVFARLEVSEEFQPQTEHAEITEEERKNEVAGFPFLCDLCGFFS